jgi:hypothetical protein
VIHSTEVINSTEFKLVNVVNPTSRPVASRQLARARARFRGAAMVEGAVVMPVLLMFLPLMTYIKLSYDAKLHNQSMTRTDVAYHAAHNCEGGLARDDRGQGGEDSSIDASRANQSARQKGGDDGSTTATSTKLFTANKKTSENVKYYNMERTVKGESWMMCNDKPQNGSIGGFFSYASSFFTGGADSASF